MSLATITFSTQYGSVLFKVKNWLAIMLYLKFMIAVKTIVSRKVAAHPATRGMQLLKKTHIFMTKAQKCHLCHIKMPFSSFLKVELVRLNKGKEDVSW